MSYDVTALVLLAALLHAGWNALVRVQNDPLQGMVILWASGSAVTLPFALYLGPLPAEAWPILAVSTVVHFAYMMALARAYSLGGLGQVYPLARGGAPALVLLYGLAIGESLSVPVWTGSLLLIAGIFLLVRLPEGGDGRAVRAAGLTALLIALYTILDATGARVTGDGIHYALWLMGLHGFPLTAYLMLRRGRAALEGMAVPDIARVSAGGVVSVIGYGIVLWAMTQAPMGPVAALRETSVVIAALISAFLLREGLGPRAIAAAVLVAAGAALIRL